MKNKLSQKHQLWVDAGKKFRLSHAQVQMARQLGLNPKKLGSLANHDQERWKMPLANFIEALFVERFGNNLPDEVLPIEDVAKKNRKAKAQQTGQNGMKVRDCEEEETEMPEDDEKCPF